MNVYVCECSVLTLYVFFKHKASLFISYLICFFFFSIKYLLRVPNAIIKHVLFVFHIIYPRDTKYIKA